jgi:hypothetical protein
MRVNSDTSNILPNRCDIGSGLPSESKLMAERDYNSYVIGNTPFPDATLPTAREVRGKHRVSGEPRAHREISHIYRSSSICRCPFELLKKLLIGRCDALCAKHVKSFTRGHGLLRRQDHHTRKIATR